MPTSVSNNSKWTTNNSWPFSWPFYSYPPLPHELTIKTNMSSPWKPTWPFMKTNMSSPWKPTWPFLEKPPTTRVFYQQDLSTGYTNQLKKTNLTHNYVIWTTHLNPSEQPIWTTPKINPHRNTNNPI